MIILDKINVKCNEKTLILTHLVLSSNGIEESITSEMDIYDNVSQEDGTADIRRA